MVKLVNRIKSLTWTLFYTFAVIKVTKGQESYDKPRHYVLNLTQTTWADARDICAEGGGTLATIYDFSTIPDLGLADYLIETDEALVWIGLYKAQDDTWVWDNNETVTYNNWLTGDAGSSGDCAAVTFRSAYTWVSQSCTQRLPFLCQYEGGECRFEVYQNASIAAHNYMYLYDKTAEECVDVCLTSTVFVCLSFEYDAEGRRCQFNSGNMWTLSAYFSSHQGWVYYHRTCNSGEITGELLDLTEPSTTSTSIPIIISTTSEIITPTSTFIPETSFIDIECSETFVTQFVYVTHDVYQTTTLTITEDVFVSRDVPVTREIYVTNDVILSTTVTETEVVTVTEISTVTLTPSPIFFFPSESIYQDPVEELMELETEIKEKAKNLKKVSIMDDRPSATYVGYIAILFLSLVFGAIVVFDLLTLCQSGLCMKCVKKCRGNNEYAPRTRMKLKRNSTIGTDNRAYVSDRYKAENDLVKNSLGNQSPFSDSRLWRKSLWAVGDSGFGGSGSEATTSDNGSFEIHDKDTVETVTIEIQDGEMSTRPTDFIIAGDIDQGDENKSDDAKEPEAETENDKTELGDMNKEKAIGNENFNEEQITSL